MKSLWWVPVLALAASPALAREKTKVAVLGLKAAKGLDEDTVKLLDELLLTEIQESGRFEVLGSSDITSMMSLEEERVKLTGCTDDSCLVEVGNALGVKLLVASSVGAVGENFLLNIKALDVSSARVLKRVSEVMDNDQAKLIGAIRLAVGKLIQGMDPGAAEALVEPGEGAAAGGGGGAAVEAEEGPGGFAAAAPWLALGLAVAAGAAGGALVGLGASDEAKQQDEVFGTADWESLKDSGETRYTAGGVLLGVAGAAAVGTLVLFLVGGGEERAEVEASVAPLRGGVMAAASVGF